jgi:hypothetical protein
MSMGRLLSAALCLTLAPVSLAMADCISPSPSSALTQSEVVFRGTVVEMKTIGKPDRPQWGAAWTVTFDVSQVWKGVVGKRFVLHIVQESEDDAFETFERGSDFLVFATRNSPRKTARFGIAGATFGAAGCSGTVSLPAGTKSLSEIGPGKRP